MPKSLALIIAACAVALAPRAVAEAQPPTPPIPVHADSDLLRQLVRLLDTGSVTVCPGQTMGSFGYSCPPDTCL